MNIVVVYYRNDGVKETKETKDLVILPNDLLEHYQTNVGNHVVGYLGKWTRCVVYFGY